MVSPKWWFGFGFERAPASCTGYMENHFISPPNHLTTNPPTHQPTNPPTHQPTNPPTHQPTNPPTHQPTNPPPPTRKELILCFKRSVTSMTQNQGRRGCCLACQRGIGGVHFQATAMFEVGKAWLVTSIETPKFGSDALSSWTVQIVVKWLVSMVKNCLP